MIDESMRIYGNVRKIESRTRFVPEVSQGEYEVYKTENPWSSEWSKQPSIKNIRQLLSLVNGSPIKSETRYGVGNRYRITEDGREFFMSREVVEDLEAYKKCLEVKNKNNHTLESEFELIP